MINLKNKVCIITGATSGIGKVMARHLSKSGAQVGLVARNREKAEVLRKELVKANPVAKVDIFIADFSMMSEVQAVAMEIKGHYPKIDRLINNAGLIAGERKVTADGLEWTFAVNHLSHFILTLHLLDSLKAADEARVITTSSDAHKWNKFDLNNLQLEKHYGPMTAYGNSKLENILFTRKLAESLEASNVKAYSFHPGAVSTSFGSSSNFLVRTLTNLFRPIMISPEQGAETGLFLATEENPGANGGYFQKKELKQPSNAALSEENKEGLWERSMELARKWLPE